jgi:hypothetical protein
MTRAENKRGDVRTIDLFDKPERGEVVVMGPRAFVLRGFALPFVDELLCAPHLFNPRAVTVGRRFMAG